MRFGNDDPAARPLTVGGQRDVPAPRHPEVAGFRLADGVAHHRIVIAHEADHAPSGRRVALQGAHRLDDLATPWPLVDIVAERNQRQRVTGGPGRDRLQCGDQQIVPPVQVGNCVAAGQALLHKSRSTCHTPHAPPYQRATHSPRPCAASPGLEPPSDRALLRCLAGVIVQHLQHRHLQNELQIAKAQIPG